MTASLEYKRYCLTLTVVDQSQRNKFRKLSRPDTFIEIWPNRETGQRGAYSVEMTEAEYHAALKDAEDPNSNLIVIEPAVYGGPRPSVPGSAALTYVAADNADSLGLTGQGIVVGCADTGVSSTVQASVFAGRIKAKKGFGLIPDNSAPINPNEDATGHGTTMSGLAVPPQAHIAIAACQNIDVHKAAAIHWLAEEVGVDVILVETQLLNSTVLADAVNSALSKNIIVVAPNGNGGEVNDGGDGENIKLYPAGYSGVLAISNYFLATDAIASDSNYGSHTFAAAPSDVNKYTEGGGEEYFSNTGGTSAASAMAAGIVARFLSGNVSPGNVKKYLADTARRTGASPIYEGHGVLQLAAAWNKLKDDQAPATNPDGSIPLPNGGKVQLPAQSGTYIDPNLPANTTVYPTGEADFSTKAGSFILPGGGSAQLASGTTPPAGWPGTGDLPLSQNSQVTGPLPDGQTPGYCQGATGGSSGQYALLFENYDQSNASWQAIEDCLQALGWTAGGDGIHAPSGFAGYDIADFSVLGAGASTCIDAMFETAGWYAVDPDGNVLDSGVAPETGDTLWPPNSWQL